MAIIKAVSGKNKGSIARVIHYIMKKEKTDFKLITGINCEGSTDCIQQMKMTKTMYKKEGGRQYKHYVLSFHPDDFKDENGNLLANAAEKAHEIKKQYNIILKLILIVFVPVVLASMILNIEKSMEILDFMYMITNVPFKRMIGFIKAVADSGDAIDIFLLVSTISFIIIISILYGWYKLSQIKWHEKGKVISEKFDYKNLDETYFLPAIYFSEFVVIVYVDIFFFIPVNSFGLFLVVAVCTHFIYQAYIRDKIKTPTWKFK